MLFWCFVGVLFIGIGLWIIGESSWAYRHDLELIFGPIGVVLTVFSAFAVIFSLICFGCEHIDVDSNIASMTEERKAIVYQLENDLYENDNDIGKRELMIEIRDWNMKIAKWSSRQDDFWLGIYYADIYDQFELIELGVSE